jgi:hypothetical protein
MPWPLRHLIVDDAPDPNFVADQVNVSRLRGSLTHLISSHIVNQKGSGEVGRRPLTDASPDRQDKVA